MDDKVFPKIYNWEDLIDGDALREFSEWYKEWIGEVVWIIQILGLSY